MLDSIRNGTLTSGSAARITLERKFERRKKILCLTERHNLFRPLLHRLLIRDFRPDYFTLVFEAPPTPSAGTVYFRSPLQWCFSFAVIFQYFSGRRVIVGLSPGCLKDFPLMKSSAIPHNIAPFTKRLPDRSIYELTARFFFVCPDPCFHWPSVWVWKEWRRNSGKLVVRIILESIAIMNVISGIQSPE